MSKVLNSNVQIYASVIHITHAGERLFKFSKRVSKGRGCKLSETGLKFSAYFWRRDVPR